jgi:hypothetical protein
MKNFTLLFFLCFFSFNNCFAQTYYPLLENDKTWDTYQMDWSLPACSVTNTFRAFVNGDTTINSIVYSKISSYNGVNITPMPCPVWAYDNTSYSTVALMREDTVLKQVWKYNEAIGAEFLLFDFSVLQNDTFITSFNENMLSPDTMLIDSTGIIQMWDGTYRKIIYMSYSNGVSLDESMIEGIGGSAGFCFAPLNYGLGFGTGPGCTIKSGIPIYGSPPYTAYFGNCPSLIGNTNRIKGKAFVDLNSNQIYDGADAPLAHQVITESAPGMFDFTDSNGNYEVFVTDTGNFDVTGQILNNFISVPQANISYFPSFLMVDSLKDFAYQPLLNFDDLELHLFKLSKFYSGANAYLKLRIKNKGTTGLNPVIVFHPDINLQFVAASMVPTGVTVDSVYWNLPTLAPFQQLDINLTMGVGPGLLPGTAVSSYAEAFPVINDVIPSNNYTTCSGFISNSFDPNDISVDRDTIFTTELPNPPYLNYLIRFQNTGNDTAYFVRIDNPISAILDYSTLEFVGASHPINIHWNHYLKQLEFKFDNIQLPDSTTNEALSHGFVMYRIKPKSSVGNNIWIVNRAQIYFDSNAAINTNSVYTQIVLPTLVVENSSNDEKIEIFPNPTQEFVTCGKTSGFSKNSKIQIFDTSGRMLIEKMIDENEIEVQINLSVLSKGIYILRLSDKDGFYNRRIIKL